MKILVITGSPRRNGNSNILVDNFIKGAEEKGHTVARFDSAFKKVHPCIACDKCGSSGTCVFDDDFKFIKENIADADMVVFSTPMYYFGISAQLKTVIDRFYSINSKLQTPKKSALILTYADSSQGIVQSIKGQYDMITGYLGWDSVGEIVVPSVWSAGSVNQTKYPQMAYEFGKSL